MKHFFSHMSFPRAVIVFCTLGSLVLGTLVYLRTKRLNEVHAELARVPEIIREIQTDAYRLSDLQKAAGNDKFKAQSEPETYIRATATDNNINMGQIDIGRGEKTPARGILDNVYKMTAQTKNARFSRAQIGNFLYKLERDSPRVKVTRIKLTPFEKVAPGEIGKDSWTFEADLTTRAKVETAPGT